MWHFFHFIVRPAEALLGVFCVLTAIVLYPNEEGEIQSKFEDFWIRVDDFQHAALSRHAAFMQQVAKLETRFLDRMFGDKLISVQSVVVSCCFSMLSALLVMSMSLYQGSWRRSYIGFMLWAWPLVVVLGPLLFASAAVIFVRKHHAIRRTILAVALVCIGAALVTVLNDEIDSVRRSLLASLFVLIVVGGFACDIVFILVTRRLVRWAGEMTRSVRVLAIIALNLLFAVVLIAPILLFSPRISIAPGPVGSMIFGLSISNIFDALLAFLFVLLAVILIVHRAVWPLLNRTLFRMTDIGTKGRRAILTAVGIALLSASVFGGKFPDFLKDFLKLFGG